MSYNSDEEYGDDLVADFHDTVATLPLPKPSQACLPSPTQFETQPTQLLKSPPRIEVEASSPLAKSPSPWLPTSPIAKGSLNGGRVSHIMAPPGTLFKPPMPASPLNTQRARSETVDSNFSDDDQSRPSETQVEKEQERRLASNVKKTTFVRNGVPINQTDRVEESPAKVSFDRFSYNGSSSLPQKRSADLMADAYGYTRRPDKLQRQTEPSKALPIVTPANLTLDDIQDYSVRETVVNMMHVFPPTSVAKCFSALKKHRYRYDDALSALSEDMDGNNQTEQDLRREVIDLTKRDDLTESLLPKETTKPVAKRNVVSSKSIQQKWGATSKPSELISSIQNRAKANVPSAVPEVRKRRLVRPATRPSPPLSSSPIKPLREQEPPESKTQGSDIDEGVVIDVSSGSASDEEADPETDLQAESDLLQFLNSCTLDELVDVASQPVETLEWVLNSRPFQTLHAVRAVTVEIKSTNKKGRTRTVQKEVGSRLVEVCLGVFQTYNTVDRLVAECEDLGRPVRAEMAKWGLESAANNGELEMTEFDHDSGIGTPNSSSASTDGDERRPTGKRSQRLKQPSLMNSNLVMKDYQIIGLNWLALLFSKKMSGILADDMGLGKTCQVIAFLTHLCESNKAAGPHLIVVPGSTLENWLREFQNFSPELNVQPYYGSQKERSELQLSLMDNRDDTNVIVTTYDMTVAPADNRFLRHLKPVVCVFDEGHALKNSQSKRYQQLMKIPATFRLLLTGTPLQNNLQELISLLAFIMPTVFQGHEEDLSLLFKHKAKTTDDGGHAALLSADRTNRARSMMTPFILRRKKQQVLKHLPAKVSRVEYCELPPSQRSLYTDEAAKAKTTLGEQGSGSVSVKQKSNVLMELRKAAIHPLLFRLHYTETELRKLAKIYMKTAEANVEEQLVYEDLQVMTDFELHRFCKNHPRMAKHLLGIEAYMESGKVTSLVKLLKKHIGNGDRTLLFSQFTMVMDILEEVFEKEKISFSRLDGGTKMAERQDLIDQFTQDKTIPLFMLSTKAGGAGINLACANKVIIFDSSFNPQDDIQAENRAHRVGQTRDVEVIRLVAKDTIEEQIMALGKTKLALDDRVAGETSQDTKADEEAELEGMQMVQRMLHEDVTSKSEAEAGDSRLPSRGKADLKDEFLEGLKEAGLKIERDA